MITDLTIGNSQEINDDFCKHVNLNGLAKNVNWLNEQRELGLLTSTNIDDLVGIMNVLQNVYPDLWDLQILKHQTEIRLTGKNEGYGQTYFNNTELVFKYVFRIIIRFPEIVITNSRNKRHTIYELFVQTKYLSLNDDNNPARYIRLANGQVVYDRGEYRIRHLSGLRLKMTNDEYQNGYLHSHLGGFSNYSPKWNSFCLGHGEINNTFAMLFDQHNTDLFNMLCYQIGDYVVWESLEGGPHKKFTEIVSSILVPLTTPPQINASYYGDDLISRLKRHYRSYTTESVPRFNWKIENGLSKIIEDGALMSFLKPWNNINAYVSDIVLYKDANFYYTREQLTRLNDRRRSQQISGQTPILFRGEELSLEIIDAATDIELPTDFIIHPSIVQYIKSKIETTINYGKLRNDTIQRSSRSLDSRINA